MSFLADLANRYRVSGDPLRTQRLVELAVVLLLLLLVLQLLWGAARLAMLAPPLAIPPAADALEVLPMQTLGKASVEGSNEMRSRPVFWVSRRPESQEVALVEEKPDTAGKATPQELKNIKLLGVFGSAESTGIIAFVKGKKRRLLQGEEYEGWTLDAVRANEVVFKDGARSETLVLKQAVITAPPPPVVTEQQAAAGQPEGSPGAEPEPAEQPAKPAEPEPPARLGFEGR